ncbi:MAG: hypothetical protein KatS3mg124_1511 [Porticoccaceae bacterium]|nr:MAG: hypothetical protein KatS3mg124_1511 [Porticoccaceae bacterium]
MVGRALALIGLCLAEVAWACPALPVDSRVEAAARQLERASPPPRWRAGEVLAALVAALEGLADDGLDPEAYGAGLLRAAPPGDPCTARLATRALLAALADLSWGRVDPARHGLVWYAPGTRAEPDPEALLALARRAFAEGFPAALAAARPALPSYRHLRRALAQARAEWPARWPAVPPGPTLRLGDRGARVAALRARLAAEGLLPATAADPGHFDASLVEAVANFQRLHGLEDDGVVGPKTLVALNESPGERIARLRVNLERLRWFARDWREPAVLVDIAGAVVSYVAGGEVRFLARAQAGRPDRPTPPLVSRITRLTVNPAWTVPPTILYRDVLPAVRRDPGYLARHRLRVFDGEGREVDPAAVDWRRPGALVLRQDPGPHNALGRVAIRFPNPFAVYLHDTPNRHLFATSARFYSSGCVRVEGAVELARHLLAGDSERARFARLLASGRTAEIPLARPVHLVIAYWTALANEAGVVTTRPDVYQRDARLLALLELGTGGGAHEKGPVGALRNW